MSRPTGLQSGTGTHSTKDTDEELALRFLTSVLAAPVTVHDQPAGHSTYDLEIDYTKDPNVLLSPTETEWLDSRLRTAGVRP